MRTAIIEIVFPRANENEVPTGIVWESKVVAERWGGIVVGVTETPTTDLQKALYDDGIRPKLR